MDKIFLMDYKQFTKAAYTPLTCLLRIAKNYELRFLYSLRKFQRTPENKQGFWRWILMHYRRRYGLEIICLQIGGGLRLIHPWGIVVNANATIGERVTLYKGVTIGEISGGSKQGVPNIGNGCVLYANATVLGNISVGDNSEIAAGAFVNFDVPPNSIVIGNPGVIHRRQQ